MLWTTPLTLPVSALLLYVIKDVITYNMTLELTPTPDHEDQLATRGVAVPSLIANAGQSAIERFLEFFAANIRNPNTRRAYARAARRFFEWCQRRRVRELTDVKPLHVAAYIETRLKECHPQTVKQELAAIRMLFDWLVVGQIVPTNPAGSVRGPKYVVKKGKTPILSGEEARLLLESIDVSDVIGLRDRTLIAMMLYTFARVGAVLSTKVEDCFIQERRLWIRLHEKGGKRHEMPCHHNLEIYLDEYLEASGLRNKPSSPLFPSTRGKTKVLTDRPMRQQDVHAMITRRGRRAGIKTKIGCHSFRGTGITVYLMNGGTIEAAQQMANHESPRTTKLYDRRDDRISLDEVERIVF